MTLQRGCVGLLVLGLTGCQVTEITTSSRSYLGPSQSGAVSERSARDTALEATRLFEVRGYALHDQRVDTPQGELLLRFTRRAPPPSALARAAELTDIGSMFYVWVTPTASGSTISLLGKPTFRGIEPCTKDGVMLACRRLETRADLAATVFSGQQEVEVARGVLSQLALEGYTVSPLPAAAPPPTSDHRFEASLSACQARRRAVMQHVLAEPDQAEKRRLFDAAPTC